MDILFVSHATFRAVNRSLFNLMADKYGMSVAIVAPKTLRFSDKTLPADPPANEQEAARLHFLNINGSNPRTYDFDGLYELADRLKPRVIYLENDPISFQAHRLGKWCRSNNAKLICLSCENLPFDPWNSFKRAGLRGALTGMLKLAQMYRNRSLIHHVFTINDAGTQIFRSWGFKSVSKTPLGFDPELFKPDHSARKRLRTEMSLPDDLFVMAYVGRVVPEKGIHILLQSLKPLLHLPWVLLMDEFEEYKTDYALQVSQMIDNLGLKERVLHFHASHREIAGYMNAADAIIVPSVSTPVWVEQYGRVAPEAMACGKIVVAARSGALPELIGDAGLMFKEGDAKELSDLLSNLIQQPERYHHYSASSIRRASELDICKQSEILKERISN